MHYFQKYLTTQQEGAAPSGAETVEKLCDRVASSTLLEDRRDAVRALKSLSKKFRLEVGTQGMGVIMDVLKTDRNDAEIAGYALDTLCNVMSDDPSEEDDPNREPMPADLGIQFTEMFIKDTENPSMLLLLLEEYDFHIRWPVVKLLTILLTNKCKEIQEIILVSPMGVSKLMDLLIDSREIIRNDGLLLLIQLTRGNANIQKIVAFESAFERLLDIVRDEGGSDGGIVVEDCLLLLLNLLRNNQSNQNFFKEGSFIQQVAPYFDIDTTNQNPQGGWSAQKVTNIHLMLQLVRTLVSPNNQQQQTIACQKSMNQCGLLQQLCVILMASGVPADVLTETINTTSEIIRGNENNQSHFASVLAPSNPPRPAIVVLLMSMVNEKQPFILRCATLYCFQSFLCKNKLGQSQIIQTLLPSTAEVNTATAGQLLCSGLFSTDSLSAWFAAVALLHAIDDNVEQKEQLLRVQLATSLGNPPVSLLQQCMNILAQGGKVQTRSGLLMLLCHWLADCPLAVTQFLCNSSNVPVLISQISASEGDENEVLVQGLCAFLLAIAVHFLDDAQSTDNCNKESLRQIMEKRIGIETFTDKLNQITKHESYIKAAKKPQLTYEGPNEVFFDYEFTRLFKRLENDVLRSISQVHPNHEEVKNTKKSLEQHQSIVNQYQELIREQDAQLSSLRSELEEINSRFQSSDQQMKEMSEQIQQLKDQNALLKIQKGGAPANGADGGELQKLQEELESKDKQVEERDQLIEKLKNDLTISDAKLIAQTSGDGDEVTDRVPDEPAVLQASINRLNDEVRDFKSQLLHKEEEIQSLHLAKSEAEKRLAESTEKLTSSDTAHTAEKTLLSSKLADVENRLAMAEDQNRTLTEENKALENQLQTAGGGGDNNAHDQKLQALEAEKAGVEADLIQVKEELDSTKKEQEDLLVLLADQDTKIANYKSKLKELGQTIEDDDEDVDFDDEEDEDTAEES